MHHFYTPLIFAALLLCFNIHSSTGAGAWELVEDANYHLIIVNGNGEPLYPGAMRRQKADKTWEYDVDPKHETDERFCAQLDLVPHGSLLVWIDNIFGNPVSEEQRRFGIYQTAILSNGNLPKAVKGQISLKCFGLAPDKPSPELAFIPQHHGDFSKAPFWDPNFWKIDDGPGAGKREAVKPRLASTSGPRY